MWTEITLIERGRSLQSKYFLYSGRYPPSSILLFSPPQGDFRLVDFYLNLICKKSPRVAIVIVVSLRARPLLNRRRRSRKRRDGGRIISSHPRKLQKCRKWKLFMIHFALTGALIANDFRDGRKCGFKGPAIFLFKSLLCGRSRIEGTKNLEYFRR